MIEHPSITKARRDGYPGGTDDTPVRCPECESECERLYVDKWNEVAGCDCCVREYNTIEAILWGYV